MKLYTEQELRKHLCNHDERFFEELTPIELPSDEEIEESETDSPYDRIDEYNYGFIDGANWVKKFLLNQTNQIK